MSFPHGVWSEKEQAAMLNKPSEELIKDGARDVTQKDVENVITRSEELKRRFSAKGPLARFVEDGKLLIAVIKDYWAGLYREIPYGVIASMVFTLIYVLNPFDLLPDVLPLIGQLDDMAVMGACLIMVEQDLHKYKDWKEGQ
jgi:uncharacterized membrane protein YkvA (DUF1232 family)